MSLNIDRMAAVIVETLEEREIPYESEEAIYTALESDPDSVYDRLIDLAREHDDDPVVFYALAEHVVKYEQDYC